MQIPASLFAERVDVLDHAPNISAYGLNLLARIDKFLERTRYSADAAARFHRSNDCQNIEQALGILNAFDSGPIRLVNLFLDPFTVKVAIRKPVDGENITVVPLKPGAEFF